MRSISERMRWPSVTLVLVIVIAGILQASEAQVASKLNAGAQAAADEKAGQPHHSAEASMPNICVVSEQKASQLAAHGPHTVKLSWHPSVPATMKGSDAIACYLVYRSANIFDPKSEPIGVTRAPDTTYSDLHVEPRIYHYAVRAVSVTGAKSDFSKELSVEVPR